MLLMSMNSQKSLYFYSIHMNIALFLNSLGVGHADPLCEVRLRWSCSGAKVCSVRAAPASVRTAAMGERSQHDFSSLTVFLTFGDKVAAPLLIVLEQLTVVATAGRRCMALATDFLVS